ncbi:MAG: hypothetical protein AB7P02_21605 [Alphaproteobacteria bacterium]
MILFVTTAHHTYAVASLVRRTFGVAVPHCAVVAYEELFAATTLPTATVVFTDFDRLFPWEVRIAAEIFAGLRARGVRCLNDPARTMVRFELLRTLHDLGFNPFDVYRADERPRPRRFPVFIRNEADHIAPRPLLIESQDRLDRALEALRGAGNPLRGLMVVEYAGEEIGPGMWRKFTTFRIGEGVVTSHGYIAGHWMVKTPTPGLAGEAHDHEELGLVASDALVPRLRRAFEIAGVDWGRADHATFTGREIVFEINVNPDVPALKPRESAIADRSVLHARRRIADHLHAIDTEGGPAVRLEAGPRLGRWRDAIRRADTNALPRP